MADQHHFETQVEFSSNQPQQGSPETEFRQSARTLRRDFFNEDIRFSDGTEVEVWSFEDDSSGRGLPAPLVRVREGDITQIEVKPSKGPHTIHWHGVEPDPRNDGVGHTSFEVTGGYVYQWRMQKGVPGDPNKGTAGTYFYHCHVNTVLHVQMGMFGPLVVDPVVHPSYPIDDPTTTRRAFVDGPLYDLATETLIAPYSLDADWHELNHAAGLSGENAGLNRFEPTNFYVLGKQDLRTNFRGGGAHELRSIRAQNVTKGGPGAPTLLRIVNANYFPTTLTFTDVYGSPIELGEVISHDGRPFRDTSSRTGYSRPVSVNVSKLGFGSAERYEILLWPKGAAEYVARFDWFHWVRRDAEGRPEKVATRKIPIVVV